MKRNRRLRTFQSKLLAAAKAAAYITTDKNALAGLSDAQIAAAALAAKERKMAGYVIPLQNTTQQPDLAALQRDYAQAIFENSWNRAERGDPNDTRATIARLAQFARRRPSCLAIQALRRGSSRTRWPRHRKPR